MSHPINIERLAPDTIIHRVGLDFGPFGSFAVVQSSEFNGESYAVSALFLDEDGEVSSHAVEFIVDAGETVEFGGRGEPVLRAEADVTADEWDAKLHSRPITIEDATDAFCALLVRRNGAHFYDAAVRALGVPQMEAAE